MKLKKRIRIFFRTKKKMNHESISYKLLSHEIEEEKEKKHKERKASQSHEIVQEENEEKEEEHEEAKKEHEEERKALLSHEIVEEEEEEQQQQHSQQEQEQQQERNASQSPEIVQEEEVSSSQVAIDVVWLSLMEEKSKKSPKLLDSSAANASCSIFRVPQNIKVDSKYFQPCIVSIGPYYHGEQGLHMIEEHKWRILRANLDRLKEKSITLQDLFNAISVKEKDIRQCYSENIDKYSRHKLIEMMILDGGFIIELLCVANSLIIPKSDDPIFNVPWIFSSLTRDLLMLENQIPFFVLQILYAKSVSDYYKVPSLQELIIKLLFKYSLPRFVDLKILCKKYKDYNGQHILDFCRWTFLPSPEVDEDDEERCCICLPWRSSSHKGKTTELKDLTRSLSKEGSFRGKRSYRKENQSECCCCLPGDPTFRKKGTTNRRNLTQSLSKRANVGDTAKEDEKGSLQFIQPVEKLREAGIKFKKREEEGVDSFLDIKYKKGTLEIPCLTTSEMMSGLILNCIAFEQCYKASSKHFTSYYNFMGYLINTTTDAGYLRKKKIIEDFSGSDQAVVSFFNEAGKNIPYYFEEDYLIKICKKVEIYYRDVWHVRRAEIWFKCCGSPLLIWSACVALLFILLSLLQGVLVLYKLIKGFS